MKSPKLRLPIILDSDASWAQPDVCGFGGPGTGEKGAHAEISFRAYSMWECAGRPPDRDLSHWLAAEVEVLGEE